MTPPVHRRLLLPLVLTTAALAASCANKPKTGDDWPGAGDWDAGSPWDNPLPSRDESVSMYGPGSGAVDTSRFSKVYFAFDSYAIGGGEMAKVDTVAAHMRNNPGDRLLIAGYTDQVGTEEYNRVLGERRALAVREALVSRGVDSANLQTFSFGEDMPDDPYDDAANRRVAFGLYQP